MPYSREIIQAVHRRLAQVSISASTLRNQGGPGIIEICRNYLYEEIRLEQFFLRLHSKTKFNNFLNLHTERLIEAFNLGDTQEGWGAARKALNLFFRELVYNKILCDHFHMPKNVKSYDLLITYLEIPLDRHVAEGVFDEFTGTLPKWQSIKVLRQDVSEVYQQAANSIAQGKGIPRIHLDLLYWRASS